MSERILCARCDTDLSKQGWKSGPVYHCELTWAGGASTRAPHHIGTPLHPRCRLCGQQLGCERCSGPREDLWCKTCRAYQTLEGLLRGGLHPGVALEHHPADWIAAYRFQPRPAGLVELYDQELARRAAARGRTYTAPRGEEQLTFAQREAQTRAKLGLREPGDD